MKVHPDLAEVLYTKGQINHCVCSLADKLKTVYDSNEITVISLTNGAIMFTADLIRELDNHIRLDCIRVSSYGDTTKSIGVPKMVSNFSVDIKDQHVLLIDDILDTGKTLQYVGGLIKQLNPSSFRTCVLLDKSARREVDIKADFVGFDIPDKFVVGYGLDFAERYRNLPYIGVLKPEKQTL